MMYEVEQKFHLDDGIDVEAALSALGASFQEPSEQRDLYLTHPTRDFGRTDEALRLRQEDSRICLTYKGPKVDRITKTRREVEVELASGEAAAGMQEMLGALGFAPLVEVRKARRRAEVVWDGTVVVVALDDVADLGRFVELEILAGADQLDAARGRIASLSEALNLHRNERLSYCEMLLGRRAGPVQV